MAPKDTLSCFKPTPGLKIALDIAIHHAHLCPVQKEALQLAFEMDVEMHTLLILSCLTGPMTSRKLHAQCSPTGNTISDSLLKMDLCSMEKSSSFLHQKGKRSLVLCTNHTKALPKHSCLPVVVSSVLVSTRPLRMLFSNEKHA